MARRTSVCRRRTGLAETASVPPRLGSFHFRSPRSARVCLADLIFSSQPQGWQDAAGRGVQGAWVQRRVDASTLQAFGRALTVPHPPLPVSLLQPSEHGGMTKSGEPDKRLNPEHGQSCRPASSIAWGRGPATTDPSRRRWADASPSTGCIPVSHFRNTLADSAARSQASAVTARGPPRWAAAAVPRTRPTTSKRRSLRQELSAVLCTETKQCLPSTQPLCLLGSGCACGQSEASQPGPSK